MGEGLTSFFCVVVIVLKRLKGDKDNFFLICSKVDTGPVAPPSFGCGFSKIVSRSCIVVMKNRILADNSFLQLVKTVNWTSFSSEKYLTM